MQAAAASIIVIFGACVLQEAQPYRRGSDNEIELLAQYCVFLWCFSIVFRDMGISDPKILLSMGIFLIVATVGVFLFAFWRVRAELKLLRSEQKEVETRTTIPSTLKVTKLKVILKRCDTTQSNSRQLNLNAEVTPLKIHWSPPRAINKERRRASQRAHGNCSASVRLSLR